MDDRLFLSFDVVSKIFFMIFRFLMCLCCDSDSIIFLGLFLLRRCVPCLIANFMDQTFELNLNVYIL